MTYIVSLSARVHRCCEGGGDRVLCWTFPARARVAGGMFKLYDVYGWCRDSIQFSFRVVQYLFVTTHIRERRQRQDVAIKQADRT